jgi:iron complex outermembrane recepter protein
MTRIGSRTALAIGACGAAIAIAAPVKADNTSGGDQSSLDEIVVTAQKREQRLIDVPTPVTALAASDLLDDNKTRLEDYFRDVPGLTVTTQGSGMTNLSVRGISTGNTTSPTVGITIDDIPFGSVSGLEFGSLISPPDLDPSDLQRVEVLRGPQGTLYGASSLGGLLKFVTVDPSFDGVSGRVSVDGNTIQDGGSGESVRGAVNIPLISDVLAMRASGFYRQDGGFIDDPAHGLKDLDRGGAEGGHLALLWKIDDRATLKLSALYQENSADGASSVDTNYQLTPTYGDLQQDRVPGTGAYIDKVQMYSANLTIDLPYSLRLVSLSGYAINDYVTLVDYTPEFGAYTTGGGAGLYYDFFTKRYSQEIRLQQSNDFVDWVIGGFYTRENSGDHITVDDLNADTGALINNGLLDENDRFRYDEYAGFASATAHLTSAFDLEGGLRYSHNSQFYTTNLQGPLGGGYIFQQPSDEHSLTYSVNPSYKISENLLAYLRVASGFRPGGPNAGVFGVGTPITYKPDTTVNYEAGFKGEALDKRLTFEASVFYVKWNNIQLGSIDPTSGFLYIQNGGTASSKGVELEVKARPWTGATVSASTSINKAELTENLPVTSAFGQSGDRLPNSADGTFSLDFEQTFPLSATVNAFAGGSVNYVGNRVGPFVNTAAEVRAPMPAYTLGGLRVGVRTTDGWTATGYVSNVGNSRGVLSAQTRAATSLPTDPFDITVVQPRTIGVSLSKTF